MCVFTTISSRTWFLFKNLAIKAIVHGGSLSLDENVNYVKAELRVSRVYISAWWQLDSVWLHWLILKLKSIYLINQLVIFCRLYGVRCARCLQLIPSHEFVMRAVNQVYHVSCFLCVVCGRQLNKGDQFLVTDSAHIYCSVHFDVQSQCSSYVQLSPESQLTGDWFSTGHNCKCKWRAVVKQRIFRRRLFARQIELAS